MLVQTFRGRQALDLIERLEDQLVCVDGLLSRRTLRDLGIHRVLAMSLDGAGLLELEQAVERLRALGDDLVTPSGLPPEIQSLIQESKTRRDEIRVLGEAPTLTCMWMGRACEPVPSCEGREDTSSSWSRREQGE